jgi:hypothetical protein
VPDNDEVVDRLRWLGQWLRERLRAPSVEGDAIGEVPQLPLRAPPLLAAGHHGVQVPPAPVSLEAASVEERNISVGEDQHAPPEHDEQVADLLPSS